MKATNRVFGVTQHYINALLVKPEDEVMNAPTELVLDTELQLARSDACSVGDDE